MGLLTALCSSESVTPPGESISVSGNRPARHPLAEGVEVAKVNICRHLLACGYVDGELPTVVQDDGFHRSPPRFHKLNTTAPKPDITRPWPAALQIDSQYSVIKSPSRAQ